VEGSKRLLRKRGHLNVLPSQSALNALEKRAQRFHNKQSSGDALDQELTQSVLKGQGATLHRDLNVNNDYNCNDNNNEYEVVQAILSQRPDLLEPVGIVPGNKGEGITRLFYENQDGLSMDMSEEGNLAKVKEILDEMEVDCYCFNEHKLNLQHKEIRQRGLSVMFDGGETLSKCVGGSNKHVGEKFVQMTTYTKAC
jgi:hypothetical protein